MTKEQLEKESSNSVQNLNRLSEEVPDDQKDNMQKTLSSSQLQDMFKETMESDNSKSGEKVTFVDDEDEEANHEEVVAEEKKQQDDEIDEREEESDEQEPPMKD